ncbi:uncharacterized protein SCHCODRAFT_02630358 [Schizophyllum commune H4-8]|uniref:uncharacterized protein n=1 Tax=Schizophyllum commune (strain H4-8 / FGSC 9210) TaxID=578458 RepID=UPI00216007E1|nr:uncharacterized protein SCHCODRAFT_02630358 [Schizophyllum commune H4-8]KAI5889903.1 hypothetical protein SCHCODRAFT_02630358 [Schizophyllum commune H4-8]
MDNAPFQVVYLLPERTTAPQTSAPPRVGVLDDASQNLKSSVRKQPQRRRRSHLLRMPLEITSMNASIPTVSLTSPQILACLPPQDLLSMSRLSRAFRGVLLYRPTALPLWRSALHIKPGSSRIPTSMNEVQLAHLVFGSDCQFCGSRRHVVACYAAHVRLCGKCVRNRFMPSRNLPTSLKWILPSLSGRSGILPYVEDAVSGETLFCKPTVDEYAQKLDAIAQTNIAPPADWVRTKRRKFLSDLEFQNQRKRQQYRKAEILRRMEEEGWQEEVSKNPNVLSGASFLRNKAVRTMKPLSEKRTLRGIAVAHMTNAKTARLERERVAVIEALNESLTSVHADFRRAQPFRALVPTAGDMAKAPVVRRLCYTAALASVSPTFADRWRAHCEDLLLDIMRAQGELAPVRAALGLATTVFALCGTDTLLTYPHILCEPALDMQLGLRRADVVRRMVALAGRDPHATGAVAMDALDPCAGRRRAYTWRGMLKLGARWWGRPFAVLGPWETGAARGRAGVALFSGGDALCARCGARFSASAALRAHLYQAHSVLRPTSADVVLDYGLSDDGRPAHAPRR